MPERSSRARARAQGLGAPSADSVRCPLWVISGLSSQHYFTSALPPKADISGLLRQGGFMSTRPKKTGT